MTTLKVSLLTLCLCVVGCDSDKASISVTQNIHAIPPLNALENSTTPLKKADRHSFQRHLRNGIYLRSKARNKYPLVPIYNEDHAVTSLSYSSSAIIKNNTFAGDRIKQNDQYIFIATNPHYNDQTTEESAPNIKILSRHQQGDITPVTYVPLRLNDAAINGIYITEKRLAAFSNQQHYAGYASKNTSANASFFPVGHSFHLSIVDISSPEQAILQHTFTIDGRIIDSRRIGNKLYFLSSFSPYIPGLPLANNDAEHLANFRKIYSTPISDILPKITNAQGISSLLVTSEQCFTPATSNEDDGFDGITTLTVLDVNEPESITSLCVNSDIQGVYTSNTAMYLYNTKKQNTAKTSAIHKFSFKEQEFSYSGSVELPGGFGEINANLRFNEHQSMLRVVTTEGSTNTGFEHQLFVLQESTTGPHKELKIISQLPNDTQPIKIGAANLNHHEQQDIKAVRFVNNVAFILTYSATDPIYLIDLSTPDAPYIRGTFNVPGYLSSLLPISAELLLGIEQHFPKNQNDNVQLNKPKAQGAKISLFDISNINSPKVIASFTQPAAFTPVEFNYLALTHHTSKHDERHRFGIPMERWHVNNEQQNSNIETWTKENFLTLIEITSENTDAQLHHIGNVFAINDAWNVTPTFPSSLGDRAIFNLDDIYYLHGNHLWRTFWYAPENIFGPY
ncbi:beta-propeller domain-containing protein [Thalassotalea sp. 1_MG-2023]|uniref:beta-propeller domain-containing protein n=1 Tax=Thalassotalea sp. 1_MG-2023 TaxID=3062680 RepID=UPI0026E47FFC|nr:beta-propeller domain-containing protein [Thalassotalea sp. 1_MG-2023]MDO6427225.1 beta-propeller domain-containing protein [Thalassotalea sp. 1_MG-2023]